MVLLTNYQRNNITEIQETGSEGRPKSDKIILKMPPGGGHQEQYGQAAGLEQLSLHPPPKVRSEVERDQKEQRTEGQADQSQNQTKPSQKVNSGHLQHQQQIPEQG